MSRWKYPTETVTVGPNSVTVRGLTFGERMQYAEVAKKGQAEGTGQLATARVVAKFCIVENPPVTEADVDAMPGDLVDAVFAKILILSGLSKGEKKAPEAQPTH